MTNEQTTALEVDTIAQQADELCEYMRRGMEYIGFDVGAIPKRWPDEMAHMLTQRSFDSIHRVIRFTFSNRAASFYWPHVTTPRRLAKHFDALQGIRAKWASDQMPPEPTPDKLTSTGSRVQAMNRLVEQGMSRDEAKRRVGWRAD